MLLQKLIQRLYGLFFSMLVLNMSCGGPSHTLQQLIIRQQPCESLCIGLIIACRSQDATDSLLHDFRDTCSV